MHRSKECGHGGRGEWKGDGDRRRAFFGPGPEFGPRGHGPRGRGRRARRGDIRTAALLLLAEEPRNGYQIMQEVEERSGGLWRPSPGSVYPALQQLLDEGLISEQEIDGRRGYALTDEGRTALADRPAEAPAPWEAVGGPDRGEIHDLARLAREVAGAFKQLVRNGSPDQLERAKDVLATTRRELYTILADGEKPDAS
jgi:DNA-binding PadR family transcriptional regulator